MAVGKPADCGDDSKRLSQLYLNSEEAGQHCTAALGPSVSKNLGVWLAEILCGIHLETAGVFVAREEGDDLVISQELRECGINSRQDLSKLLMGALDPAGTGLYRLEVVK
jgi:hypothetical protein